MLIATKSKCTLTLLVLLLFLLQANIYAVEAKFQQQSGADGLVVMEAENFSNIRPTTSADPALWHIVYDPADYSGACAMQALPMDPSFTANKTFAYAQENAPVLEYSINFVSAAPLYVWIRNAHKDGYDDSIWFGYDFLITEPSSEPMTTMNQDYLNVWHWLTQTQGTHGRATIDIGTAGVHVFELYMREQAFKVDKIVLTTNPDYIPAADPDTSGVGPEQTLVMPKEAKFKQQSGPDGLVVMEAENFSNIRPTTSADTSMWDITYDPLDYSGACAMQALPMDPAFTANKTFAYAQENAPVLEYSINFVSVAPLYVWLRNAHKDGYDDSIWYGYDFLITEASSEPITTMNQDYLNVWHWLTQTQGSHGRATIDIGTAGVHVFELYMREQAFRVDKIVLTTNPDYIPAADPDTSGVGPAETLNTETGVKSSDVSITHEYGLAQNYPNPFNPETTIRYSVPSPEFVTLTIFNLAGQEITRLVNSPQTAGEYQVKWVAQGLPSGIYFYRLQVGTISKTMKLILQK
jgi:hypothetical protein